MRSAVHEIFFVQRIFRILLSHLGKLQQFQFDEFSLRFARARATDEDFEKGISSRLLTIQQAFEEVDSVSLRRLKPKTLTRYKDKMAFAENSEETRVPKRLREVSTLLDQLEEKKKRLIREELTRLGTAVSRFKEW